MSEPVFARMRDFVRGAQTAVHVLSSSSARRGHVYFQPAVPLSAFLSFRHARAICDYSEGVMHDHHTAARVRAAWELMKAPPRPNRARDA